MFSHDCCLARRTTSGVGSHPSILSETGSLSYLVSVYHVSWPSTSNSLRSTSHLSTRNRLRDVHHHHAWLYVLLGNQTQLLKLVWKAHFSGVGRITDEVGSALKGLGSFSHRHSTGCPSDDLTTSKTLAGLPKPSNGFTIDPVQLRNQLPHVPVATGL